MTLQLKDTGNMLTVEQLTQLEKQVGASLPGQYRQFLAENNGGIPQPNTVDVRGLPGTPTDVQEFFGVGIAPPSSNLGWHLRAIGPRLPEGTLPFACDSGGNLFCISLRGENAGRVFYLDLQEAHPVQYFVATDFDAFLLKLRELEE